jgi:hypothetical protein
MRGLDDVTRQVGKPPVWSGNRCSEVGVLRGINATARALSATGHRSYSFKFYSKLNS